jgi:erythronate-4-phosphate dehydrogenase
LNFYDESVTVRIIADENMALVREFFGDLGELVCYSGRQLSSHQVKDADILLVRSVTQVNAQLLAKSRVRFVGSATIGADHLDKEWLAAQHIVTTTAPACNARSVVEYVITALVTVTQDININLSNQVLGVVGLGNVGYLLATVAQSLGMKVLGCDPFVTRADIQQCGFEELIATADIVSFHTPLTHEGAHPTYHLLNELTLPLLKPDSILLNTGRGAVIDNVALLRFINHHPNYFAAIILDVWEGEPLINATLMSLVTIATPHIAGYSVEGRTRGTEQVYQALCHFLEVLPTHQLSDFLPDITSVISVNTNHDDAWAMLHQVLQVAYPIMQDDALFRQTMTLADAERALAFDHYRRHYWPRRQFASHSVDVSKVDASAKALLEKLEFLV